MRLHVFNSNGAHSVGVSNFAQVQFHNAQICNNGTNGRVVWGSATVELDESSIEGNGTHPGCQKSDEICSGIQVDRTSGTTVRRSKIISNADWGIAALLKKCGYENDDLTGTVSIDPSTQISGNNKTDNHQGETCLP